MRNILLEQVYERAYQSRLFVGSVTTTLMTVVVMAPTQSLLRPLHLLHPGDVAALAGRNFGQLTSRELDPSAASARSLQRTRLNA